MTNADIASTYASSFFDYMNSKINEINSHAMPDLVNKWKDCFQNTDASKEFELVGNAMYASFFSPFQSAEEFLLQTLCVMAVEALLSLAAIVLALAATYYVLKAVIELVNTKGDYESPTVQKHGKDALTFGMAAFVVSQVQAYAMWVLVASLVTRSAVTLYQNTPKEYFSFFNPKPPEVDIPSSEENNDIERRWTLDYLNSAFSQTN